MTFTIVGELVHPFTVTVTLYEPLIKTLALGIVAFCCDEENDRGPVQL